MEFNKENMQQCSVNENDICQFLKKIGYEWELVGHEDILCRPPKKVEK
jgi:hypothetical protein